MFQLKNSTFLHNHMGVIHKTHQQNLSCKDRPMPTPDLLWKHFNWLKSTEQINVSRVDGTSKWNTFVAAVFRCGFTTTTRPQHSLGPGSAALKIVIALHCDMVARAHAHFNMFTLWKWLPPVQNCHGRHYRKR